MDKNEKRICLYSTLFMVLLMNSVKLLALREHSLMAQYWHFNAGEWIFQVLYQFACCYGLFYLNLTNQPALAVYRRQKKYGVYVFLNVLLVLAAALAGTYVQRVSFGYTGARGALLNGYLSRFIASGILIAILVKVVLLLREKEKKAVENEKLKSACLGAELELLRAQMNPHFLFNALSSLSGIIGEEPVLAQKYVRDLSNVFRYALVRSKTNLVTLADELAMLHSFAKLVAMRLDGAFQLVVRVEDAFLHHQLPHLALQPLLENAVKHNAATIAKPLTVEVYTAHGYLVVRNNLQPVIVPEGSSETGLANLNERFKILLQREIEIMKPDEYFIVKLPLSA